MANAIEVMKGYIDLLERGEHVEQEPETTVAAVAGFDGAVITASSIEAIDAAILAARAHWTHLGVFERYWVVSLAGSDHGPTGFALHASDDSNRPARKQATGPHCPGFAVTTATDLSESVRGSRAVGAMMNNAPQAPLESSPRIGWDSVALLLLPSSAAPEVLFDAHLLASRCGFLLGIDATNGIMPAGRPDLAVWGLGVNVGIDTAALLFRESLRLSVPLLNAPAVFTRYAAGAAAQSASQAR